MIVRERQRQHEARHEAAALIHRLRRRARHAENRDLRRVDDRRESRAADAAQARDREATALHVARRELPGARLLRQLRELPRELVDVLAIRVAHHRRSEEHTSELQSPMYLVCRLLLEKKKKDSPDT